MVPTHKVLRRLSTAAGDILAPADVDASAWANTRALEEGGYIRPLTPAERAHAAAREAPPQPHPDRHEDEAAKGGRKGGRK